MTPLGRSAGLSNISPTTANPAQAGDAKPRDPLGQPGHRTRGTVVQKTRERRQSFTPLVMATASSARWDAFAADCVSWMISRAESGVRTRATAGEARLLAIFDVLGDWLDGSDTEASSVVDAVLKLNERHPVGRILSAQAQRIRAVVVDLGRQAELDDVEEFAESWHMLLRGALLMAAEGDAGAPARARDMGRDLIARHRPRPVVPDSFDAYSEFGWVEAISGAASPSSGSGARSAREDDSDWFGGYGWDEDYAPVTYTP
jgi:hypothetical protein